MGVPAKIGHSFGNYTPPTGQWGVALTADDIRYTLLFGVTLTSYDGKQTIENSQIDWCVKAATKEIERFLDFDLMRHVRATRLDYPTAVKGVDFDDEEDPYAFDSDSWSMGFGFLQLRHHPVISVEKSTLYSAVETVIMDLTDWVRVEKEAGQLFFYPRRGTSVIAYGPFLGGFGEVITRHLGNYPQGMAISYTSGYATSLEIPEELRMVVGWLASLNVMQVAGTGMLPGLMSSSISLDGLSESFSSTKSGTTTYFGAQIETLTKQLTEWKKTAKGRYCSVPLMFA